MSSTAAMPGMPAHHRTLSSVSSSAEDLFSSITGFDDFANEDDLSLEDIDENGDVNNGKTGAKKGRKLASTAEKKATHNAVERARRESLNVRFLVLADMLPGMNHVKRASKAGIVNKSIALIQELQATEKRLGSENEALKAELEAMRQQLGQAQAAAAAATAAAGMMSPMHFPGLPGMPNLPAMMQQQAHHQHSMSHPQQQMQQMMSGGQPTQPNQEDVSNPHLRRSSAPMPSLPNFPGYPGIFATSEAIHENGTVKSEQGCSPASDSSKGPQRTAAAAGADLFSANGLFDFSTMNGGMPVSDLTGQLLSASPASYANSLGNSPPGTVASLVSDKASSTNGNIGLTANNSNNNPSPASSTSISTPGNTFSPAPLPFDPSSTSSAAAVVAAPKSATSSPSNPVLAAFDNNADAAFLAAQFAPRDLAKAQSELQAFMAYQQRMAAMGAGLGFPHMMGNTGSTSPSPTTPGFPHHVQPLPSPNHFGMPNPLGYGFAGQFPGAAGAAAAGPHAGMGMPAWQMMMAQQQALSTYGGLGNQF